MKSYIAQKLIIYIVLFSSVITLIITAIQLYTEFQYDVKGIYQKLEQIKTSYQQSITQFVWVSDREQLQIILDGITELPDIVYAGVIIKNYTDIDSGTIPQEENIEFTIDLKYKYNSQSLFIGQFVVVASLADVYSRLLNRLWIILLSNAFKTSLVAVFIYYLFTRLVTRHLSRISVFSEKHDVFSSNKILSLHRRPGKHDEFDTVVEKINDMRARLHEKITEINHQKKYLSQTLNSIGDAVIATDKEGRVTHLNPVAERLTGWTNDEALKQPLKTVFPIVNASTREAIENPVEKVLSTGETVYLSNHTTLISKDGTEYQIADSAAPIMDGMQILGMVLVFNDVTKQYLMREKLKSKELEQREILQSMVDAVITIDENGIVYSFNHSAESMFGYSVDEVLGKNINCLMPEPYACSHDTYIQNYTQTGEARVIGKGRDVTGLRKNKEIFPMRLLVAELPSDVEGKRRFIGSCTDLTELREHEEQIRRSQKMDALGKLIGGIAHDYNNMLGVVLGYSEILKNMLTEQPKQRGYIEKIIHAGERGANLTKKLLAFSRNKSPDVVKTNINAVLQDARNMLEKTLTARIKLEFRLEPDLCSVCLDAGELEDAILNICINAMHAIEGNGRLTIETENIQINNSNAGESGVVEGTYAQLSIIDTGCGMDDATREKIFDPFFTTKGEKGTGLGLSQVYGFISRCGGVTKVDSELQQGTRFTLCFPECQRDDVEKHQDEIKNEAALKGKETILVVDDEPALLDLNAEILSQYNYRVFSARNAEQALEVMANERIDLLISDIIMPDMDGYALARIVREKFPAIKIQLVSGFSGDENIDQFDNDLSQHLLCKPCNAQTLLTRIRTLLG